LDALRGPIHGVAPIPERNADFTRKLAAALHRPALFPVPGVALKLALGGFGGALLEGQRARPQVMQSNGFEFEHPTLEHALGELLKAHPSLP
jgi:NAD dependent epimerase/dehydratase family enzyme